MKPVSPELLALLKSRQFFAADCYTISLVGGTVLRYCAGDQDLVLNGYSFPAGKQTGPYFDRTDNKAKVTWQLGTQASTLVVDVIPGSATVEGAPFLQAIRNGIFDAADFMLERVFMPTYGDTRRGSVRMFVGRVAEIDAGRSVATFSVNSHLELLNLQFPRNLYQPGCINNLGDAACAVSPIPSTTGTVASGSSASQVLASLAGDPTWPLGTFDQGTITFTSGALDGVVKGVKSCIFGALDTITVLGELPAAPSAGDAFTLTYGCDKSFGLPVSTTGNTDGATDQIANLATIAGITQNMFASGPGVPSGAYVTGIAGTSVTLNTTTTSANTGATYTFQSSNGCGKFNNLARFRGFPFVPQPVTAA